MRASNEEKKAKTEGRAKSKRLRFPTREQMLMRGHKKRPYRRPAVKTTELPEKKRFTELTNTAEIFAPQTFNDGSALVPLTAKERDTVNTMIDFFRSSDEHEHLDPEVYEAIAEKLGNGREKPSDATRLVRVLTGLTKDLYNLAAETTGLGDDNKPMPGSAQHDLWLTAASACNIAETIETQHNVRLPLAMGPLLGAIDAVLGADGCDATDCSSCECENDKDSHARGGTCAHIKARIAQRDMREALRDAGFVEDNFGAWGTP